jgi:GGDEF domain-containing protein
MVSIGESITELDKLYELQHSLRECYSATIRDMMQYAVEIDAQTTTNFRRNLQAVSGDLNGNLNPAKLAELLSRVRNELREYHDEAARFLSTLRQEVTAKAEALESIVNAMASVDGDHEERVRDALTKLRQLSNSQVPAPMREVLTMTSNQIAAALDELQKQNQLNMGQFMAEIKTLHRRIESLEASSRKDVCGVASRLELETQIAAEVERGTRLALVVLKIDNLPIVQRQFGAKVRVDAVNAFAKRMAGALPAETVVGRWGEDQFMVIARMENPDAIKLAKDLAQHVSGAYVCTEGGKQRRLDLLVSSRLIPSSAGLAYEELIGRINQYL